jgi:hypothetical protein
VSSLDQAVSAYKTLQNLGLTYGAQKLEPVLKQYLDQEVLTLKQIKALCTTIPICDHKMGYIIKLLIRHRREGLIGDEVAQPIDDFLFDKYPEILQLILDTEFAQYPNEVSECIIVDPPYKKKGRRKTRSCFLRSNNFTRTSCQHCHSQNNLLGGEKDIC